MTDSFFVVPGEPKGKGRPRVVRRGAYTMTYSPQDTRDYETEVRWCWRDAGLKRYPDDAHLYIRITAYFKIPKSVSKKKREMMLNDEIRPTKKPDLDNIAKIICDALNGEAYKDDAAIVDLRIKKYYSENPRVEVFLTDTDELPFEP